MESLYVSISLSGALFALTLSVISLVLHWIKRASQPDTTELYTKIQELQLQIIDLGDKVQHWRSRDNVRRARQGAEDKQAEQTEPDTPFDKKKALRQRALAAGLGIVNR